MRREQKGLRYHFAIAKLHAQKPPLEAAMKIPPTNQPALTLAAMQRYLRNFEVAARECQRIAESSTELADRNVAFEHAEAVLDNAVAKMRGMHLRVLDERAELVEALRAAITAEEDTEVAPLLEVLAKYEVKP